MSNSSATKTVVACESTVDIKNAGDLYGHLRNAVLQQHEVEINALNVQRIDTAIMQVFLAFMLEAQAKGMTVKWQGVSDAFRTAAELLGICDQLDLPNAA